MSKKIKGCFMMAILAVLTFMYAGCSFTGTGKDLEESTNTLPIPPLLEDKNPEKGKAEFDLKVQYGKTKFKNGYEADTLGYNGNYLGPVIRVNRGDDVKINVTNTLNEPTTIHWHGLEVPAEMDGGPHQMVEPNTTWKPYFTIDQPAATLWYHPHLMYTTGEQVYKGLSGLFYIEDETSKNLNIPKEYGVDDIPLIIQDKRLTDKGDIPYALDMGDMMNGFLGDTVMINGAINPELNVKNTLVRLRLLNGSNARTYSFNFGGSKFYQIASDGGFLEESVQMQQLSLSPAERAEILIDLSNYKIGEKIFLRDGNYNLMTITIVADRNKDQNIVIPKKLVEIEDYNKDDIIRSREFIMSGMGPMVAINGKQMDMNRIDEELKLGELEEWVIISDPSGMGMMGNSTPHPFHVHSVQFRIIERNKQIPPPNERGWKDTVMVDDGEEVRILVKFKNTGLFMYHCHILEHEDAGMMGQFLVE